MKLIPLTLVSALAALSLSAHASSVEINIDCRKATGPLSPHLYGLFFEDINFAADGGLYAELVQNRSFEYFAVEGTDPLGRQYHPLYAWSKVERGDARCELAVESAAPLNANNTNYLKIAIAEPGGAAGVANDGFDGIRLDAGAKYDVSFYARTTDWSGSRKIRVTLELEDRTMCGTAVFDGVGEAWRKFEGVLTSSRTTDNARLLVTTEGRGNLCLDMISLFPQDTFNGRKNGLRKDLGQTLKDLNPKFLRFPGGCIAHGSGLDNAYRWKESVGDVAERTPNWNRWGYHQTLGLGYYEYFLLCEDIGATALPVLPVGVSCGFNDPYQVVPMDELQEWTQDALDLIEFANGPVTSQWGGLRAKMGHPEPFGLQFICLGNEEHDRPEMRERFPYFVQAVRKAHPEIEIIGTSGLGPEIPLYGMMEELDVYSSDEHYYMSPLWYLANQDRFDTFNRQAPKIFVGEYASGGNTLFNAVAEAAYLTGIERNGDLVDMACYAPLFANVDHTQWDTDLIYFDKRTVVKTPNYYVQQLFARNKGDVSLAYTLQERDVTPPSTLSGAVGVGTWMTAIEVEKVAVNGRNLDPAEWRVVSGDFRTRDGHYVQLNTNSDPAISLSPESFDGDVVTYTVRARKTAGREGFLIVFGAKDDRHTYWWNLGGWDNTRHAIELDEDGSRTILTETPGSIEDNAWYDMKVELSPGRVRCSLNGALVHDYAFPPNSISLSPTRDTRSGEIIVKLVNPGPESVGAQINLEGLERVDPAGKLLILSGDRNAENSVQDPDVVRTQTRSIEVGRKFQYTLPPTSVQFIRIEGE